MYNDKIIKNVKKRNLFSKRILLLPTIINQIIVSLALANTAHDYLFNQNLKEKNCLYN